jgi:hypothetical protein
MTGEQRPPSGANTSPVWAVVIAWAALSLSLNLLGVFATPPDRPPFPLLISVIGPVILFGIAYALGDGPHFWIVLHIISLIKLRNPQAAAEEAVA